MDYRTRLRNVREELKIEDLIILCRFYNLSADYLIGLTDREKEAPKN